jgi:adenylate cyclase
VGEQRVQRRLAAILAADVVGFSRLAEADEEGTLARLKEVRRELVEPKIAEYRGRTVKLMGDGALVEFTSAVDAVRCAVDIQRALVDRNAASAPQLRLEFRVGINLGDIIIDGDDIFGDGVNLAVRLEGLAVPGGICISDVVHRSVDGKVDACFEDLGEKTVKNILRPVRVYQARSRPADAAGVTDGAALPLPDKPSVAVLPFDNMSRDAEQEYFSDGITEDIITELSKISGLFVIARHSTFVYKGKPVALKQVGRDLGVRYVLEGSVRKAGNRLRITAQLIDAPTDRHLWAERFDRDLDDVFAVQDEVARKVAEALAVALEPDERARVGRFPTDKPEVYDQFLRLRATPFPATRDNILNARSAFEHLVRIDATFAGGHAGLSLTYSLAVMFGHSEQRDADACMALDLAERAVALDADFAPSHRALGMAHAAAGRFDEAIAAARRGVELQPGDAEAHAGLAHCLLWAGRGDDAREATQTAFRLDPRYVDGPYLNMLGRACLMAGRHDEAVEAFERNSDRGGPISIVNLPHWTAACVAAGRMDDARRLLERLRRHDPDHSLARVRKFWASANPVEVERLIELLRKAGLPEMSEPRTPDS